METPSPISAPPTVLIRMLNRRWGYGAPEGRLQGYSGKAWGSGTTRYAPEYACHYIDLTLEEYNACREDIFKAAQLSARTWEPVIILRDEGGRMKDEEDGLPDPMTYAELSTAQLRNAGNPARRSDGSAGPVCEMDIALINDPDRLRERAEAIDAWEAGRPVDKYCDGQWIELTDQTAFFFERRYRARPGVEEGETMRQGEGETRSPNSDPTLQDSNTPISAPAPEPAPAPGDSSGARGLAPASPREDGGASGGEQQLIRGTSLTPFNDTTPLATLRAIAKAEGVEFSKVKNCASGRKAIREHREKAAIETQKRLIKTKPQGALA